MDGSTQSHQHLLARFYRAMLFMCLTFLFLGVPFLFVRKHAVIAILLTVILHTGYCWQLAWRGRVQQSLNRFALLIWWIVVPMIYLGQSSAFMGLLLSISILLAVVVSTRAGLLYGLSYLAASFLYVVLVHFNMAPPPYFIGTPTVQWFLNAIVFWITLLPITTLINELRHSVENVEKEFIKRSSVEAELRLTVQAAQQATVAKSQFLANMSHEIRTPMNAIIGMLKLLQNTELSSRQKDYAVKSDGAAHSLLGLLNDILDFSKVEAGKLTLEQVPFCLEHVLRNLAVVLFANVGKKRIEVLFDIDPNIAVVLVGDPMRLQQVLINLGGNAIKFTEHGEVVLSIKQLDATAEAENLEFAVRDSGIGITAEDQKRLFTAFSQAESSTTRRFGGTGLGLSISKRLVELMGGSIHLQSASGEGSTFSFTLSFPVAKEVPEELTVPKRTATSTMRALIVDDNPIAGELLSGMVQSWGWSADVATSGLQALELVERERHTASGKFPYPVIYLDWLMSEMDGLETARRLRDLSKQFKGTQPLIIMVTANGRELLEQRSQEEQESLNGFLVKPVTASMLLDETLDAMGGKSGIRQITRARSSKRRLNGVRILVVEDNLINQQVAEELLMAEGAIVSLAANGQLGVDAVSAAAPQFDVVLMDIQMPVLDGYAATQVIRTALGLHDLPIVAMTANAMASDRDACLSSGMTEHVGKPFDMGHLVSLLLRITGIHVSEEQSDAEAVKSAHREEKIVQIPGLELETALARMSGLSSLYVRSALEFLVVLETVPENLQGLIKGNDKKICQRFLHTLKGNAATLGATELASEAARLERMCVESEAQTVLPEGSRSLSDLCRSTHEILTLAIVKLQGANGGDQESTVIATDEPGGLVSSVDLAITLDALQQFDILLCASNLSALQFFADLRGKLRGLPSDFENAIDAALQALDLEKAHDLCLHAFQSIDESNLKQTS
jgi:two-component system sensor histidine kinase/response regulator